LFRPYFEALIKGLECTESDQQCFYALSVLLTMTMNPGRLSFFNYIKFISRVSAVDNVILESVCLTVKSSVCYLNEFLFEINLLFLFKDKTFYNTILVDQLCDILLSSTTHGK
jgi:hypothetical protein